MDRPPPLSFEFLPRDVLVHIWSFVGKADQFIARFVCKRFNTIFANSPPLGPTNFARLCAQQRPLLQKWLVENLCGPLDQSRTTESTLWKTAQRGYLEKERKKHPTMWKKRFFCLVPTADQFFYASKDGVKIDRSIDLFQVTRVVETPPSSSSHPFTFEIATPTRTYALSAASEKERSTWINSLNDVVMRVKATTTKKTNISVEDFELLTVIARTPRSKVYRVRKKGTLEPMAMKRITKKTTNQENLVGPCIAEFEWIKLVQHPLLIRLHHMILTPEYISIFMDVAVGELWFILRNEKRFDESKAKFYAAEILLALEHLHIHNVAHSNLRPENILLQADGHIVLSDALDLNIPSDPAHLEYTHISPEQIRTNSSPSIASNYWAFGSIIYEMLCGLPPFYSTYPSLQRGKILAGELNLPASLSPAAGSLISSLLNSDPTRRLCDPFKIKLHSFFHGVPWLSLAQRKIAALATPQSHEERDMHPAFFDDDNFDDTSTPNFDDFEWTFVLEKPPPQQPRKDVQ